MEWVKPIDEVEADFRRAGAFLLVDPISRKLRFYGYNQVALRRMIDGLRGRSREMANFLIDRAKAQKGETT